MLGFVHPDYQEMVIKRSQQQELEGKPTTPAEEKFVRRDGSTVDVEVIAAPFQYQGKMSHLVISRDITDRKQADEILREKEDRFRATFENANVGVCIVGLDGRLLQVNRQMCEMFGYSRDELERMTVNTIAYPEDTDISPTFIREAISGEVSETGFDKRYIHKDGHVIWGHVSSSLVRDPQGNPLYFISHVQDITERKQAEEALQSSNERLNHLLASTGVAIYTAKPSGDFGATSVTENVKQIMGYDPSAFIEQSDFWIEHVHPEDKPRVLNEVSRIFKQKRYSYEYRFLHKDGAYRWVRDEMTLIENEADQPVEIVGYWMDITERKQAEEAMRALALRHEALLSAIPEIIMEVDKNKIYTWANPAGKEFFGEDVIGKEAAFYFEGEQDVYGAVQPLFNGEEGTIYVESRQRRRDGEKRLLGWWCRALKDDQGNVTGSLSSARDITEQRTTEEKILDLSRFPEENPNPVMRMTPDGLLLYANKSSQPFLTDWNIEPGQIVPEECRVIRPGRVRRKSGQRSRKNRERTDFQLHDDAGRRRGVCQRIRPGHHRAQTGRGIALPPDRRAAPAQPGIGPPERTDRTAPAATGGHAHRGYGDQQQFQIRAGHGHPAGTADQPVESSRRGHPDLPSGDAGVPVFLRAGVLLHARLPRIPPPDGQLRGPRRPGTPDDQGAATG